MARANRHYIPGHAWHITHKCHKGEFLLKFAKDRQRWRWWLFQAKKRYGLCVLNYMVTSNHIHLLVLDRGQGVIPKSIQLIAGRVAQEYNHRKQRKGAFWEDRYHATIIESGTHLMRALAYIDLNMVRAAVVKHPSDWTPSGYNEIQTPSARYQVIDYQALHSICGYSDIAEFRKAHHDLIADHLANEGCHREACWTEGIAVGSADFMQEVKKKAGFNARGRRVVEEDERFVLRETAETYRPVFLPEKAALSDENGFIWDVC